MGSARRFTDTDHDQLVAHAKLGLSLTKTAALHGVARTTLSDWLRDNDGFRLEFEQAQAGVAMDAAKCVALEARKDPKIALEVLRVQDPEAWMRREGRELTGANGGPVKAEVAATEPRHEELAASVGKLLRESSETHE